MFLDKVFGICFSFATFWSLKWHRTLIATIEVKQSICTVYTFHSHQNLVMMVIQDLSQR